MPTVSVILSVYRAETTLRQSLEAIRHQTFRDFEVIVVDSSLDSSCEQIVTEQFPEFRYIHHPNRLSVDAARNMGFDLAKGMLVGSTDPDCYSSPDWLAELVAEHDRTGALVIGGVGCFGDHWMHLGAHLCKFDKWLPGGPPRMLNEGPTANLLISRHLIEQAGGFLGNTQGDTDLCWRVRRLGSELRLAPKAVVEHHHLHTWSTLLRERYERGREFGELWLTWHPFTGASLRWRFLITVIPARLVTQLVRVGKNAARSGMFSTYLLTFPIVLSGLYCWLLGEARAYFERQQSSVGPTRESSLD
jgi:glycosyltransferase involved in cell wall biosynthesis